MYGARQGPQYWSQADCFGRGEGRVLVFRWVVPDTHDYFLLRPGRLSSKSGADMIISCGDQRLVGSTRQCPTLAVWALRLGGVVFQRLHQNSYPGRLVFSLLRRWGGVPKSCPRILDGVVFQKFGWCIKKLSQNLRWGGVPKVWVVFQKVVPDWSKGRCSKSWGGVSQSCPRIPTLYTTHLHWVFL